MSREGILRNWMDHHDSASSNHEQKNGTVREALTLVTGAARGIGRAIAKALASEVPISRSTISQVRLTRFPWQTS
jgi:hypothetical protein